MEHVMTLTALPAFSDNYIWLLNRNGDAAVVDPGDAQVVQTALETLDLELQTILVTHHHADHIGGVDALRKRYGAKVYASSREEMATPFEPVHAGSQVDVLGHIFEVLDVPGHTAGHIAFFGRTAAKDPLLFCGDTLFAGGCGRIFEGTPVQMHASLQSLAALPGATQVCCAHEYTLSNLRFALAVDPHNEALQDFERHCQHLRQRGEPTVPTRIDLERQINPFLRIRASSVRQSVARHAGLSREEEQDDVAVFAALREWKNNFK